jgi:CRISPR-associated protein Csm1
VDETDEETGEARSICHWCWADLEWGRRLPKATWLLIRGTPTGGDRDVCGLRVSLPDSIDQVPTEDAVAVCSLRTPQQRPPGWPTELILERRLARHIPADQHGRPLEFQEIAQQATGDNLLGVLKMDADDLGAAFGRITRGDRDLRRMTHLSKALDLFMAETIDAALKKEQWRATYTIFAGGDDLLLVGPWDLMIDFAWEVRTLFAERFREIGLTISAGLALMKPTRPIRNAAGEAEHLLDNVAKKVPAPGAAKPKDQIAAFRQVWKWEDHRTILGAATRLVKLVKAEKAERGWLHTLLEISQSRLPQGNADAEDSHHAGMAAARLAYHIGRNYPKVSDPDRDRANLRAWADTLVRDLDTCLTTETRYLPTISRYALTATRVPQKKE